MGTTSTALASISSEGMLVNACLTAASISDSRSSFLRLRTVTSGTYCLRACHKQSPRAQWGSPAFRRAPASISRAVRSVICSDLDTSAYDFCSPSMRPTRSRSTCSSIGVKDFRSGKSPNLFEVVFQLLAAARVPELAKGLGFDLADALSGDAEPLPHFFQRPLVPVDQAKSQLQHAAFARRERIEDIFHLRAQHRQRGGVRRRGRVLVLHEVAKVRVFLFTNRRFERDRILGHLHDLPHLLGRDPHLVADLLVGGLAAH